MKKRITIGLIIFISITIPGIMVLGFYSHDVPGNLGVREGRLAECTDAPNCVSTQTGRADRHMQPIPFRGDAASSLARLRHLIEKIPRTRVIKTTDDYLHVEFRSFLFRFVDDVEFFADEASHEIHFRSASRAGYSDFGVNRARMIRIREKLESSER